MKLNLLKSLLIQTVIIFAFASNVLASHYAELPAINFEPIVTAQKNCPNDLKKAFAFPQDSKKRKFNYYNTLRKTNIVSMSYYDKASFDEILTSINGKDHQRLSIQTVTEWSGDEKKTTTSCISEPVTKEVKLNFVNKLLNYRRSKSTEILGITALMTCYDIFSEAMKRADIITKGVNSGGSSVNTWEFQTAVMTDLVRNAPIDVIEYTSVRSMEGGVSEIHCKLKKNSVLED